MELIDRDVLFNSLNDCSCECGVCQYSLDGLPCGLIENAPTVEAIPKADYENRLKADLIDILTELSTKIGEIEDGYVEFDEENKRSLTMIPLESVERLIDDKINALKADSENKE